ncbi:MAG: glycosyltransferase family 2 protein [Patescibacteria group bacterium]|nr:glycosyltransferase family 2 protein [Patescibacteria group bacterium]
MHIFCIIPAWNEEQTITEVIQKVKPLVDEVVVIDDGSTDKTYELALKQNIIVLRHIINRGQGAALETGNQYALQKNADIIVHFDADAQFCANEISEIVKPIATGKYDVVFGSRFLEKKSNIPWVKKHVHLVLAKIINKLFYNISLSDPQSGFRALSKKAVRKIRIKNNDMAHCSEIIHKSFQNKLRIKEVPITVVYHNFGQKFSKGIEVVKDLVLEKIIS